MKVCVRVSIKTGIFFRYMTLVSMGAWFQRKYELAVFATALSAFLSWPFAVLIG